jgi:MoxR-like ATPase
VTNLTTDPTVADALREEARKVAGAVLDEVDRAVVGKREAAQQVLLALCTGGHALIEDLPGLGKTLLARSLARVLGLSFTRVQFTPDLLPSDLTGSTVLDPGSNGVTFRRGPVFTNVLLADEINRTPPKTQAALLEAMAEQQVSVDGETHPLPDPFLVLATDNPIELDGTYPLPEAQLDRFSLRISVGYLSAEREAELLLRRIERRSDAVGLRPVADAAGVRRMRQAVETVEVHPELVDYLTKLLEATRAHQHVAVGASSRAGIALLQLSRARALLDGRSFLLPDDIKAVAAAALAHRISVRPELWVRRVTGVDVIRDVLTEVPTPVAPR